MLCHSVRVGVPLFTGRQPSQNGQCLFLLPVSGVVSFCEGWRPVVLGDANPHGMATANLFPVPVLFSRSSEKSRMRCLDKRGREIWDWVEQKSLYKKNSPHKVGEETLVRMGARRRQ